MVFVFLILMPALLVHAAASLLSRRRVSMAFAACRSAAGILLCMILCVLWLIPQERMSFFAADGRLGLMMGKSAILACAAASTVLGACFGLFVREREGQPAARKKNAWLRAGVNAVLMTLLILTQCCV